jgi:hypothetical protein
MQAVEQGFSRRAPKSLRERRAAGQQELLESKKSFAPFPLRFFDDLVDRVCLPFLVIEKQYIYTIPRDLIVLASFESPTFPFHQLTFLHRLYRFVSLLHYERPLPAFKYEIDSPRMSLYRSYHHRTREAGTVLSGGLVAQIIRLYVRHM